MEEEEEGVVRSELDAADLLDPNPDILGLFCHYNDVYFDSKLHACTVAWSTSRMTLCAGICKYDEGSCAIRLSEPLLKFRSSVEVKETLLHEMIHAYLWLTNSNQNHDDHGPSFQKMMQAINASQAVDHQRPTGGYYITIYHNFSDEVDSYRKHHWKCFQCGDLIKRATNRSPSQADCYQKIGRGNVCNNEPCHWHRHQQLCGGEYEKIAEPEGYKDRRLRARKSGTQSKESKMLSDVHGNKVTAIKQKIAADNLGTKKIKNRVDSETCQQPKNALLEMYFSLKSKCSREEATQTEDHCQLHGHMSSEEDITEKTAKKRGRNYKFHDSDEEDFCSIVDRKRRQEAASSLERATVQKNECTVIIGWKSWYAVEDEEDEKDIKALKNKRSQRRMSERDSSQLVNVCDSVISADSSGYVLENQHSVPFNKEMVRSEEDKAVGENARSPPALCVFNSVVGVTGATPRQLHASSSKPVDQCAASHATTLDSVRLEHNGSVAQNDLQVVAVRNATLGPDNSFSGVPSEHMEHGKCATAVPCHMEQSLSITLNGSDEGMDSQKSLDVEAEVIMVGVSKNKTLRKGGSKRRREDHGLSNIALPGGEPSAVCPICQRVLFGNIEDANFNTKVNEHIDACMRGS